MSAAAYTQKHSSSLQLEVDAAVVTKGNMPLFAKHLRSLIATKPDVHNVVLRVPHAPAATDAILVEAGFRKQNAGYFVLVVKPIALEACTAFLEINATNAQEHRDLLPALTDLCPLFLTPLMVTDLGDNESLFVLLNDRGVPCSAALTMWMPGTVVHLSFLCALVKGAGKRMFDHVVDTAFLRGFGMLTLLPASEKLRVVYREWMGARFRTEDGEGNLTMLTTAPVASVVRRTKAVKRGRDADE
jgi:hypothetical protein